MSLVENPRLFEIQREIDFPEIPIDGEALVVSFETLCLKCIPFLQVFVKRDRMS